MTQLEWHNFIRTNCLNSSAWQYLCSTFLTSVAFHARAAKV